MTLSHTAHIEPIAGIIRVFGPGLGYGDPYTFAATLRWIDRDTAEVMGVIKAPTASEWRALKTAAAAAGIKQLVFHRKRPDGREHTARIGTKGSQ